MPIKHKIKIASERVKSLLFYNKTIKQTIFKNAFWLGVSNFGGRLLRSVIIIYAARVLGAASWGTFSYAITLVAFLTLFVDIGISPILNKEIARTNDFLKRSRILSTSLFLKIILASIGVAVVIFIAPKVSAVREANLILPAMSLILVFDIMREFGLTISRALEKMELEAGLFLLTNLAIVIFGFIFLRFAPNIQSFTYGYVIGTGIGAAATFYVLRENFKGITRHFSSDLIWPILVSAWPFAISGIFGMLLTNTDVLLVGWLRSTAEVGFLSAAGRIIQLLYLIPGIIASSILPTFSRLAEKDNATMRLALERAISIVLLVAIPLAIGGLILGSPILGFIFGKSYLPGVAAFKILSLTLMFDFPAAILGYAIFAFDKQKKLLVFYIIGGVFNVALDLLLIPKFGITGSAWATFAAMLASNSYLWWEMKKINYFRVLPYIRKIVPAALIMGIFSLVLFNLNVNVLTTIVLSALIYFGVLYFLKEPVIDEIRIILRQKNE